MRRFKYLAVRSDGAAVEGHLHARLESDVDRQLLMLGLQPVRVTENEQVPTGARRPARHDLALLLRSMASLCDSGVPILAALVACEGLSLPGSLRSGLMEARALVREGESLASALEHTNLFRPAIIAALQAGERGGQLQLALQRAAAQLEYEAAAVARLKRTLAYPIILFTAGCFSSAVIGFVILPRFTSLLEEAGLPIPLVARAVLAAIGALEQYWPMVILISVLAILELRRWIVTPPLRARLHGVALSMPFLGRMRLAWATAQVARSLATMLETGLPLLRALEIAADGTRDDGVRDRLGRARARVANGGSLSASLLAEGAFLPGAIVLVGVGEASGRLPEMLLRSAEAARTEAERSLDLALTLLEPGLILVFAGMVALLATAMFQSIYSLRPAV